MRIGIVDCGGANINSICYSLKRLSCKPVVSKDIKTLLSMDKLIMPGVGSADKVMKNIRDHKLIQFIKTTTKPVLGICIGMQILFEFSDEGNTECLGILKGNVKKIIPSTSFPVPQMGWNYVNWNDSQDLNNFFYYANSYAVFKSEYSIATSNYSNKKIISVVKKDNFVGCQFHPEKSSLAGHAFLKNFLYNS